MACRKKKRHRKKKKKKERKKKKKKTRNKTKPKQTNKQKKKKKNVKKATYVCWEISREQAFPQGLLFARPPRSDLSIWSGHSFDMLNWHHTLPYLYNNALMARSNNNTTVSTRVIKIDVISFFITGARVILYFYILLLCTDDQWTSQLILISWIFIFMIFDPHSDLFTCA